MEEKKKTPPFGGFLKGKRKLLLLIGGALLGVLLLVIGSVDGSRDAAATTPEGEEYMNFAELQAYKQELESELEKLCDAVSGVSSVEVIVTLECGARVVYAADAQGEPVTVGSGSAAKALCESIRPPVVAGVGVVCRGGAQPSVQKALTDLISTALGINTNRVIVVGK